MLEKTCSKCGKTFPRNKEYFYEVRHPSRKEGSNYSSYCITCSSEATRAWKEKNKESKIKKDQEYRSTEKGYFKKMWSAVKLSKHGNEFKDYDEFFNHWVEQQKTYGKKCPYLNIEMTTIRGVQSLFGKKTKTCPTNISRDRIDSSKPYSKKNLMFVSWKVNSMKSNITPLVAKRFIGFWKERFGDE